MKKILAPIVMLMCLSLVVAMMLVGTSVVTSGSGTQMAKQCPTCHGSGAIQCPVCHGNGKVSGKTCGSCEGSKKIVCPKCGGAKSI